jgi:hypothetical protein
MFSSSNVLSVNGKLFAMPVKGKLVMKLPKKRSMKWSRRVKEPTSTPATGAR